MGSKEHNSSYDPVIIRAFSRLDRVVPGRQLNIGKASIALGIGARADDEQRSAAPKFRARIR